MQSRESATTSKFASWKVFPRRSGFVPYNATPTSVDVSKTAGNLRAVAHSRRPNTPFALANVTLAMSATGKLIAVGEFWLRPTFRPVTHATSTCNETLSLSAARPSANTTVGASNSASGATSVTMPEPVR